MGAKNQHELGELDILCSKDKSLSTHPGNRLFRGMIEEAKAPYNKALDKATKMKITKNIVDRLHDELGCRFVKFDNSTAAWVELSRIESRDKVGHALRFAIKGSKNNSKNTRRSTVAKRGPKKKSVVNQQQSWISTSPAASLTQELSMPRKPAPGPLSGGNARSTVDLQQKAKREAHEQNFGKAFLGQQELFYLLETEKEAYGSEATSSAGVSSSDDDAMSTHAFSANCQSPPAPSVLEPLDLNDCGEITDIFSDDDFRFLTACS
ncbi:hypothetical protein ACA910_004208 [Epithemia clementina (nom. ined.)]